MQYTAFGAGTFSWQDPVHSSKAGPGEVMTVENLLKSLEGKTRRFNLKNDSVTALFSREAAFEATSSRTPTSRKLKRMYVVKHTGCNVTNFFCTQNHLVS